MQFQQMLDTFSIVELRCLMARLKIKSKDRKEILKQKELTMLHGGSMAIRPMIKEFFNSRR
jgi:hypothetical protein